MFKVSKITVYTLSLTLEINIEIIRLIYITCIKGVKSLCINIPNMKV